jgi:hypothetical protein
MGHNLQDFKVYDGTSTEVSNNIFPLHKSWRIFRELGRVKIGYENQLPDTQLVFDVLKNAYQQSSGNKFASAKDGVWLGSTSTGRGKLYFYAQWPLIYFEAIKESNPQLTDAQAWEQAWDIYTLLYLHKRQINAATDATWPSLKTDLGFSQYNTKPLTKYADGNGSYPIHDVMLVSLSLITRRNQTPLFDFWGVTTTAAARNQVTALNLPAQAVKFYAARCSDDLRDFQTVDMSLSNPTFPWPNEYSGASDTSDQVKAKERNHNNYCNPTTQ